MSRKQHGVPNHKRCKLCGRTRGLVIYSNSPKTLGVMFAPGIALCPHCDFVGTGIRS
jgi:hypothetical protein